MPFILLLILFLVVTSGPQLWAKRVLARHSGPRDDLAGTGGELARHLITGLKLPGVKVESTDQGDHYDPTTKAVRSGELRLDAEPGYAALQLPRSSLRRQAAATVGGEQRCDFV